MVAQVGPIPLLLPQLIQLDDQSGPLGQDGSRDVVLGPLAADCSHMIPPDSSRYHVEYILVDAGLKQSRIMRSGIYDDDVLLGLITACTCFLRLE